MKLKTWLREWLSVCVKNNVKLKTYNRYKDIIELHIIPNFDELEIAELDYGKIAKFIAEKRVSGNIKTDKPLSQSSVNGIIIVLKNALNEAIEFGHLDSNPCSKIKKLRGEQKQIEALTIAEQRKLEKFIIESKNSRYIGILIGLYTGLRIGELLALTWKDIDFAKKTLAVDKTVSNTKDYENNYITITQKPKTASSKRLIPIPQALCDMLKVEKKQGNSLVVAKNKKSLTIRGYQYMFENILKRLNIKKVGFHSLRHTFATRALECGFDIKTLSEIMGHSSVAITINLYAHSQTAQKVLMMEKLNKIYPKYFT